MHEGNIARARMHASSSKLTIEDVAQNNLARLKDSVYVFCRGEGPLCRLETWSNSGTR